MAKSSANRKVKKARTASHEDPQLVKLQQLYTARDLNKAYNYARTIADKYTTHRGFLFMYGETCFFLARYDESIAAYNRMLQLNPADVLALHQIGKIADLQGHRQQAIDLFVASLRHDPYYISSLTELRRIYFEEKQWDRMLHVIKIHLSISTEHSSPWRYLFEVRDIVDLHSSFPELQSFLIKHIPNGNLGECYSIFIAMDILLRHHLPLAECVQLVHNKGGLAVVETYDRARLLSILQHPLMLCLLKYALVPNPLFEKVLTGIRHALLADYMQQQPDNVACDTETLTILAALALYQFNSEYIANTEPQENEWHAQLRAECENWLRTDAALTAAQAYGLCLLGSYQPLEQLETAEKLMEKVQAFGHPEVMRLAQETYADLALERRLARDVPSFSPIDNSISQAVREQYEESPYPRWRYYHITTQEFRHPIPHARYLFPQAASYDIRIPKHFDLLIAGCGTGRHPISVATRYSHAKLTCIDLSTRSLAYAMLKAKETPYASRLEFLHGDILQVSDLRKTFAMIESVGVLHHMKDPMAGWRKLTGILQPGGLMRIGLYSKPARESVIQAREEIARLGYGDSIADIRAYRRKVLAEPTGRAFLRWKDFYSTSECRDLLFHRQEHQFTIPMIAQCLKELGLVFLGFDLPPETLDSYYKHFPDDKRIHKLEHWQEMEELNPALFIGMYQFWCYKPVKR